MTHSANSQAPRPAVEFLYLGYGLGLPHSKLFDMLAMAFAR